MGIKAMGAMSVLVGGFLFLNVSDDLFQLKISDIFPALTKKFPARSVRADVCQGLAFKALKFPLRKIGFESELARQC